MEALLEKAEERRVSSEKENKMLQAKLRDVIQFLHTDLQWAGFLVDSNCAFDS